MIDINTKMVDEIAKKQTVDTFQEHMQLEEYTEYFVHNKFALKTVFKGLNKKLFFVLRYVMMVRFLKMGEVVRDFFGWNDTFEQGCLKGDTPYLTKSFLGKNYTFKNMCVSKENSSLENICGCDKHVKVHHMLHLDHIEFHYKTDAKRNYVVFNIPSHKQEEEENEYADL